MKKLNNADITTGIDGGKWIRIKRTKTKSLSSIPLPLTVIGLALGGGILMSLLILPKEENIEDEVS